MVGGYIGTSLHIGNPHFYIKLQAKLHDFLRVSSLFALLILLPELSSAQSNSADSTDFAFLPAVSYNSDLGLIAGGVASWYNYKDNTYPFYSYVNVAAIISTKGLASFSLFFDKPNAFEKNIRLTSEVFASRFFEDAYFGISNYTKITDTPPDLPLFYQFQSFSMGTRINARVPIYKGDNNKQLDANFILNFRYETPWDNGTNRLITLDQPLGVEGGRTSMLGTGLIWENRNSEFQPTRGNYVESRLEIGKTLWGSSYNLLVFENNIRQYFTFFLIRDITFAGSLFSRFTSGDVPYWKLSYAGDEETLRGYESRRFVDDHVLLLNTELRTWLFTIPDSDVRFGGTLFMDTGRTFANGDPFDLITSDLKTTFGFGGLASFFAPDFIIRADFGFSDEGVGIYFTTGFMF